MSCVAIITARGGSKRIPRKNIRSFHNEPIIAYSIKAALESKVFDEVMVSTDDEEISRVAIKYGAKVPFLRSGENSNDFATTVQVLKEVLLNYKNKGIEFDYACCIYPTAPFVTAKKIKQAFDQLVSSNADSVLPIAQFSFPIWRSFKTENGKLSYNWPEFASSRSQDLPKAFFDCGQFYFFKTGILEQSNSLITGNSVGIEMPESEVQDIDTEEDWKIAEMKFSQWISKK